MARDKEKTKETKRRYYYRHREKLIEKQKELNAKNRERYNAWSSAYMKEKNDESMAKASYRYSKWSPSDDAALLELVDDGKTYEEIAEELGRSIAGVSHRLHRIRREKDD